jgi:hypothetical protein
MADKVGRPKKWATPQELQEKINAFFDYCKKQNEHPIVEGLCIFLNCDKQTILNYQAKDEYGEIIENAKLRIANHVMGRAMSGEINPTIAIWISKNHYGYKDKTEVEQINYNKDISITDLTDEEIKRFNDIIDAKHTPKES